MSLFLLQLVIFAIVGGSIGFLLMNLAARINAHFEARRVRLENARKPAAKPRRRS